MTFLIEQACPQCGAPIELAETDRLLHCPYCNVNTYLAAGDYYRFMLPNRVASGELYHVPYLHFRGMVYLCHGQQIDQRLADISLLGIEGDFLPANLGVRPQAVTMKFASPEAGGRFLAATRPMDEITSLAVRHPKVAAQNVVHSACIGEALNLIYLPVVVRHEAIYDGLTDSELCHGRDCAARLDAAQPLTTCWRPVLLSTLCPQCGWAMEGDRDSVALGCRNCHSVWEASGDSFRRMAVSSVPATVPQPVFLPFWKISLTLVCPERECKSFADFLRLTNQPRQPMAAWEGLPLSLWSPAFKIKGDQYLTLCGRFTLAQHLVKSTEALPAGQLYPVTMGRGEALDTIKVLVGHLAQNKKSIMPLLAAITPVVLDIGLVFVPFADSGRELHQGLLNLAINKQILALGRML